MSDSTFYLTPAYMLPLGAFVKLDMIEQSAVLYSQPAKNFSYMGIYTQPLLHTYPHLKHNNVSFQKIYSISTILIINAYLEVILEDNIKT